MKKKLLTFANILGSVALVYVMVACQTTSTANSSAMATSQKEMLLSQAGFKTKTVTTPKQQQQVSQLAENKVSAVKYKGKLYYVYPTAKKDQILVGKQAQFDAYKQALQAQQASQQASQKANQQAQMLSGSPERVGETAGPRHVTVEVFDGFGPLDPMSGD
jgi:hypothetical protein